MHASIRSFAMLALAAGALGSALALAHGDVTPQAVDVSTLKELARRWKPEVLNGMVKHGRHEALADIHESIEELRYYRAQIMKI